MDRADLDFPIGELEGIPLEIRAIRIRDRLTVVEIVGVENALRGELDAAFAPAFAACSSAVEIAMTAGRQGPDPPIQPGLRLNKVRVHLADDLGTEYAFARSEVAGTQTPWDARIFFRPAVPDAASRLTVSIIEPMGNWSDLELRWTSA